MQEAGTWRISGRLECSPSVARRGMVPAAHLTGSEREDLPDTDAL